MAISDPSSERTRRRSKRRRSASPLLRFDRTHGCRWVAGADEAGRGSLAGPLVAAAVLFDLDAIGPREMRELAGLNDSKQQTVAMRDELYPKIFTLAAKVAITARCAREVDARGLHKTNLSALKEVLQRVGRDGCICLSDGFAIADLGFEGRAVIDGDASSAAIAAASVIAKVSRDRLMHRLDKIYPGWGFASHVGYSTPEHRATIRTRGISPIHRRSFQSIAYQQLAFDAPDPSEDSTVPQVDEVVAIS